MHENQSINTLLLLLRKTIKTAFRLVTNDLPEPAAPNPQGCCPHVRHIETAEIWRTGHLLDSPRFFWHLILTNVHRRMAR